MNVSQGLCYRYFPSKEAIYDAGINEYADFIVNKNMNKAKLKGKTLKEQIYLLCGKMGEYSETEKDKKELYEFFHKEGNQKLHDQLFLKVGQKLVPIITKVLIDAKERGEINIYDPEAMAYFFIFGQVGILIGKDIPEEDKAKRIQECLIEALNIK